MAKGEDSAATAAVFAALILNLMFSMYFFSCILIFDDFSDIFPISASVSASDVSWPWSSLVL